MLLANNSLLPFKHTTLTSPLHLRYLLTLRIRYNVTYSFVSLVFGDWSVLVTHNLVPLVFSDWTVHLRYPVVPLVFGDLDSAII